MSLGIGVAGAPANKKAAPRRSQRLALTAPVDVVILKSGVPATIPGRAVDVSEGGISTILAGELRPGESVGVDFRLSTFSPPIQARAVIRHSSLMRHGLQFLAMSPEQLVTLRTWLAMSGAPLVSDAAPNPPMPPVSRQAPAPPKPHNRRLRWGLLAAGAILSTLLTTAAWWGWNYVWSEPVDASESTSNHDSSRPVVDVSSAEMEQRLIHRAIPVYPASALQAKVEGVVVLDTIIGTDGAVQHVQVLSGPDALSSAAMDAVRWWRFQPYQRNGRPVRTHTILEVDFRLNP